LGGKARSGQGKRRGWEEWELGHGEGGDRTGGRLVTKRRRWQRRLKKVRREDIEN